jgi:hypothetical protein
MAGYGEWCPKCYGEIVSVTRGIPSMGKCTVGHETDRRDVLRRKPAPKDPISVLAMARSDAIIFGIGWVRILPDGSCERIDQKSICITSPEPDVCACGMSGPCMSPECKSQFSKNKD